MTILETCYQCHKECEELYQVKVIDKNGKLSFEKVCSEECGSEVIDKFYHIHLNRAEEVNRQIVQRLR